MDYAITSSGSFYGLAVSGGKVTEINTPDKPDGVGEMIQRIIMAIKTHLGERLLNNQDGLPWTEEILIKGPKLAQITSYSRAYLLSIEGVVGVPSLVITIDTVAREMNWALNIETTEGITGPFNVVQSF